MKYTLKNTLKAGFSLLETFGGITILGVILIFAIPDIGSVSTSAKVAKDQHHAISIVSAAHSAYEAGAVFETNTCEGRINEVIEGVLVKEGAFKGKIFAGPKLMPQDLEGAKKYIKLDADGQLVYDKTGSQSGS